MGQGKEDLRDLNLGKVFKSPNSASHFPESGERDFP